MEESYFIKVKKLKPLWQRLGFSSEKSMLQNQKKYVILK
jgi:hypothetical protein